MSRLLKGSRCKHLQPACMPSPHYSISLLSPVLVFILPLVSSCLGLPVIPVFIHHCSLTNCINQTDLAKFLVYFLSLGLCGHKCSIPRNGAPTSQQGISGGSAMSEGSTSWVEIAERSDKKKDDKVQFKYRRRVTTHWRSCCRGHP